MGTARMQHAPGHPKPAFFERPSQPRMDLAMDHSAHGDAASGMSLENLPFGIMEHLLHTHDMRFVALAACICLLGCFTTLNLMMLSHTALRRRGLLVLLLAAIVFGGAVWSLHFVAMIGFMPEVPVAYDVMLTALSILIAVVGTMIGLACWRYTLMGPFSPLVGGAVLGLAITGMHYTGVSAMRLAGQLHYASSYVVASVLFSIVFGCIALMRCGLLPSIWRRIEVAGWLALSICGLHFIGMAGLWIELDTAADAATRLEEIGITDGAMIIGSATLAAAVALVALSILLVSFAATLMEQHLARRQMQDLNRMRLMTDLAQEVIMIHADGRVLEINSAGARLFGQAVTEIIGQPLDNLFDTDSLPAVLRHDDHTAQEMNVLNVHGESIPVELSSHPIEFRGGPATAVALRDLTDRRKNEARIRHLAYHDALTNLPNRFLLQDRLTLGLDAAAQNTGDVAILCLDLDRFKSVNDLLGHASGDELLVQVGKRLRAEIRSTDTLARIGGDEFVIVVSNSGGANRVADLATRMIDTLSRPFDLNGHDVEISVSIGIAFFPADGLDADALMRAADTALYRAKQEGRGPMRVFEASMGARLQERRRMEEDLRRAVARGEMMLFYQPLVNCRTGEVDGFEALLRWQHPERGLVQPADFIPLAEDTGVIVKLGEWVINTACEAAAAWPTPRRIAVNVSAVQFRERNLPRIVAEALARSGLDPARLEIEVTESVLLDEKAHALGMMNELRALGVHISLDDFGTGYSSLSYLSVFPFDKIKLDRSFVRELGHNGEATRIVNAIIDFAHKLGLPITIEGVETPEQLALLCAQGSDQIQGYLIARPGEMENFGERQFARARDMLSDARLASVDLIENDPSLARA